MQIKGRGWVLTWAAVAILFSPFASADHHQGDEATAQKEIAALYAGWRAAVEASSIPGYLDILHDDIRMLPPGAPAIVGREAYGTFLIPVFEAATYTIQIDALQVVDVVGEMAVAEYDYTIALHRKDADVGVTEEGALTAAETSARYFDVLLKTDEGWKVWRHSWQVYP